MGAAWTKQAVPPRAASAGARCQLTCEGWEGEQEDRSSWVLPRPFAPAQPREASSPSKRAGWTDGRGLCHRTASWRQHTG